ncbi:hypothetical protein MW871_16050 [Flavobacterium sp. I-SCBP12n]|uniref:Uncharacterized protein n=1 Tax=Flavobacterium pygoscelis TaxID=2893176 RepID=A0A9X1XTX6_9FLAO|nr:hypothetical protein [Flavobacterium pygoscelis]MCK8143405.1 hypothetical protein [Flavobacterium pygoscelis]
MDEIFEASLFLNGNLITVLDYPKIKNINGEILIDCYLIDKTQSVVNQNIFYKELYEKLSIDSLEIKATTKQGSVVIFKEIYLKSSSFPSFEFTFICYDHYIEYILCNEKNRIEDFCLNSIIVEGIDIRFTKTTTVKRERYMFGIDDSRTLSITLDNTELYLQYFSKKRHYDLKIGIFEKSEENKTIILRFFGDNLLPYRIYKLFKNSLKYFLSYIAGNNVIIREESFAYNYKNSYSCYLDLTYSIPNLTELNKNHFLPIFDVHFKHKGILQDYLNALPNYFFLDKKLNLSEVIYLINQSKNVNIESSFFILLIAIEKLSNNLIKSNLIESRNNFIIDNELFKEIKPDLLNLINEIFKNKIPKKEIETFKTKIGNINLKTKTDNKIDLLLDFCEISRNEEIDLLFPKLRNLAIHEGEISFSENDANKNYHTLFILINSMLCNLIQYKGIRFIEHKNKTNYITKKETFSIDYKNYR